MFKKKPAVKTLSPLKSSERRRVADRIIADFGVTVHSPAPLVQEASETKSNNAAATTSNDPQPAQQPQQSQQAQNTQTQLRNLVLPENALSAKFTTTHGPNLTIVHGIVYVASFSSTDAGQRVLWFSIDDRLYPSGMVITKIKGGADLMTPGLAGPPFPPEAHKGATVAVADFDNPSVPLVVGSAIIDIASLKSARGAKGAAVESLHWAGDELWAWSTAGKSGVDPPALLEHWIDPNSSSQGLDALHVDEQITEANESGAVPPPATNNAGEHRDAGFGSDLAETMSAADEPAISTAEIDDAFRKAFLYGVHARKSSHATQPKFGLVFPLTQSFVMSDLVLPYLPTFTQKQSESLQIKRTSWKNIRKFIKSLEKDRLLLTKDRDRSETTVLDIDFEDRAFVEFRPYSLPRKEIAGKKHAANADTDDDAVATNDDDAIGQTLSRLTLFKLKEPLSPLLAASNKSIREHYSLSDIGSMLSDYLEKQDLVQQNNKRQVKLDSVLGNALFDPNSNMVDAEVLKRGLINRDALIDRILKHGSSAFYAIMRNTDTIEASHAKFRPGSPPPIIIQLDTRTGNKMVTRVYGYEAYSITGQPLADELRKVCASSTSVETGNKHGKGVEVMVQGPQKDAVLRALERRGVHKNWVEVVDKTKKKK